CLECLIVSLSHSGILYLLPYVQEELHPPYFTQNIVQNSGLSIMIHEWTDLIEALQKKAASKGANAIILYQADKNNISMVTYNKQFGLIGSSGTQKSLIAIAIRIIE
ncbi:MAG: hypothetical protein AB1444_16385, partial [Spirochaetota bacterium]